MITYKITLKNIDEVKKVFTEAPAKMTREVGVAISKSILSIESLAKREAPVNKKGRGGNLRQSIKSEMTGLASGKVEVGAEYGIFVEEGTRPHLIQVKNKRVLADRRAGQIFGREVNHPGTAANAFMGRAVDKSTSAINQFFEEAVKNVFK